MRQNQDLTNLNSLLDKIDETVNQNEEQISLGEILDVVGRRSFGPLLLVTGILPLAPIPGIPTVTGALVLLIAVQLLFQKEYFWLPRWLLNRSLNSDKLQKAIQWLRRPAHFLDRHVRPRLTVFSTGFSVNIIALACILIAAAMPIMETVPFSAVGGGAALTVFGLSLITRDGLMSVIAFIFTVLTVLLITAALL